MKSCFLKQKYLELIWSVFWIWAWAWSWTLSLLGSPRPHLDKLRLTTNILSTIFNLHAVGHWNITSCWTNYDNLQKSSFVHNVLKYIEKIPLGFCPPQKLILFPILQKFWPFLSCWTKCCEMLKYFRSRFPFSRTLSFYKSKDIPHFMKRRRFS